MRSNYLRYIFLIFAILIVIFAIVKIKGEEKNKNTQNNTSAETTNTSQEIKELNLGIASFDSINPILSKNKNVQDITKLIFEPLMTLDENYKLTPCLAKEWAKQNETTYIIKLNDNRLWSDGSKFTADDVKFTIDRLKDSSTIYSSNIQHITTVEVVDDTTVRIILDQEIPFFEYNLTFPILSNTFYSTREFASNIVPIGTGMYKVDEVTTTGLILLKNDKYPDYENLKIDKITITTFASVGELYNSFKTGKIDIISTGEGNLKNYIGTIGYGSKEIKGRVHDFIAFNTQNKILSQLPVRKAIAQSIDKSNIISSVYGDNYYSSDFPLDYGNWLCSDENIGIEYNVNQAKQILIDDGWSFKYKYWQKIVDYKTQRISLNFVVKASDANRVNVATNITTQLENQGIRVNLIKANDSQYASYLTNKNYDMILCSMNLSVSPDLSTFFGTNNLANYSNEEVTNIMNEVKNSNDENKLKQDYKRLGEIYKSEMPYLSLYNNKYTVAYSTGLAGTLEPNWFYQFYNIKDWHK